MRANRMLDADDVNELMELFLHDAGVQSASPLRGFSGGRKQSPG